jgi:hypothetical protein
MATKINPGLVALSADTTDVSTPFTPTDPKLLSLAAEQSNKDPKKVNVLSGMMQRMEDLQNPWKRFQGQMDEIVARTHFRPEAAMASVNEQQGRNTTELQNIGTTLAQLKFLQNQQASINNLFKPTGSGGAESTGVSGGFGGAGIGGTGGTGGPMLNGNIPLTNLENLNLNLIKHDPSLFFPALDKMTNNYSKENAKWQGPEAYDSQAVPITVRGPDGVVDTISVELTKAEIRDLKQGIFPSRLRNSGLTPATIKQKQKNASGGVVLQNHLAGGGQPMQPMGAEVEVGPLYTDAGVEIPKMAPAVRQPGMLENALTALSGSGEAQAGDWRTQFDPKLSQSQQEAKQSSELSEQKSGEAMAQEKNKAELESEKEERKEAGMFVGKIGSLSSTFDDIQRRSNAIINHASKHPEEFAYRQQSGPYSYLLSGVKAAPFINGAELANSLEAFKEKASGQDTINRRKETQGNADSLGIEYTQEKFAGTGARIGQGLTKIAQDAKNIGIDKPANTNLINAYMIQATAGKYKDWAQAWQDYKKANPKNPNPFTFQTSPEFKAVENKWSTYLDQKLGALEKGMPKDGTEDVDKNGNPIIWKNGKPMRVKQ